MKLMHVVKGQFTGMGKRLMRNSPLAKELFEKTEQWVFQYYR
jgi:hypothetical protein